MQLGRRIAILSLCSAVFSLISFFACREGAAHDQSGSCVIDFSAPPPFLGFEHWTEIGIVLGVVASGLLCAVFLSVRNSSDDADSQEPA